MEVRRLTAPNAARPPPSPADVQFSSSLLSTHPCAPSRNSTHPPPPAAPAAPPTSASPDMVTEAPAPITKWRPLPKQSMRVSRAPAVPTSRRLRESSTPPSGQPPRYMPGAKKTLGFPERAAAASTAADLQCQKAGLDSGLSTLFHLDSFGSVGRGKLSCCMLRVWASILANGSSHDRHGDVTHWRQHADIRKVERTSFDRRVPHERRYPSPAPRVPPTPPW